MTNISVSQLRGHISDFVSRAAYAGERFAIKKNGKLACVIVSIKDLELIEALEDQIDSKASKLVFNCILTLKDTWAKIQQKG